MNAENMYDAWDNGDRHEIRQQFARREEIIRMAREAGMPPVEITSDKPVLYPVPDAIERFAALVAAAEREACADVCEGHYDTAKAARAIRARGEKT